MKNIDFKFLVIGSKNHELEMILESAGAKIYNNEIDIKSSKTVIIIVENLKNFR